MGRFNYDEDYGDDWALRMGRWNARVKAVLRGRPAQAAFKELETALLAMPDKRLIEGAICDGAATCAVGEMVVHRRVMAGEDREAVLASLAPEVDEYGPILDDESGDETAEFAAKNLGITVTLGWLIAEANDETFGGLSPEERWQKMLTWTRRHIRPELVETT